MSEIFRTTLPRRMIRLRELLRLTQRDLAERAGVAASTVNELERGLARDANLSTVLAIAATLGTTPDGLLGFEAKSHGVGACDRTAEAIVALHEAGRRTTEIASNFGLHESSVRHILEVEYESRRLRRY